MATYFVAGPQGFLRRTFSTSPKIFSPRRVSGHIGRLSWYYSLFITVVLAIPMGVHAQVIVTEVMYDLPGSDTGHEWIEISNTGSATIPLADWKLFEGTTNHKISASKGGTGLAPGVYAVIADNATMFLADHPSYAGALFDSTFSLSNNGETFIIRDAKLADINSVSYAPSIGAGGDGNSLQRKGAATAFVPGSPTPGSGEIGTAIIPPKKVVATPAPKSIKKSVAKVSASNKSDSVPPVLSDSAEESAATVDTPVTNTMAVAAAASAPAPSLTPWVLGLVAFIGVVILAVLTLRGRSLSAWEIVEDSEESV